MHRVRSLTLALLAVAGAHLVSNVHAAPAEVRQLKGAWETRSRPSALWADAAGPYWARRASSEIFLERFETGRVRALNKITSASGYPSQHFQPRLVTGTGGPELFYRRDRKLIAQRSANLSNALGLALWEYYGSTRVGPHLFAAMFGIKGGNGASYVTLAEDGRAPIVAKLRETGAGVWEPLTFATGQKIGVLYRAFLLAPMRGHGLIVESMDIANFKSTRTWRPRRWQFQPRERNHYYGDPAGALAGGNLHWAAMIWNDRDQPTGRLVINGAELTHRGRASYWLPSVAHVQGRGLVVTLVSPNGVVQVGQVSGTSLEVIAELPGSEARIAAHGADMYVTTTAGLWHLK